MAVLGLATGVSMTAIYASASQTVPAGAHGAAFGLLQSAGLSAVALSPVLSGLIGAVSLRAVFVVDAVLMIVLAAVVRARMRQGS